jgi:hypothetical protein
MTALISFGVIFFSVGITIGTIATAIEVVVLVRSILAEKRRRRDLRTSR